MGWFADQLAKWRGEATKRATEQAASLATRAAVASAQKTVGKVTEDFLGFAERELERAQKARGPKEEDEAEKPEEPAEKPAVPTRADREAKAREELARLKAARVSKDSDDPSG
jgi:hypothetical protein